MHKSSGCWNLFGCQQQQRRLLLLVFIWTFALLIIFKSSLFGTPSVSKLSSDQQRFIQIVSDQRERLIREYSDRNQHLSGGHKKPAQIVVENQEPEAVPLKAQKSGGSSQCAYNYPSLLDLQFNNIHWQRLSIKSEANNSNFYLYNAYYDDRRRGGLPSVRILAMIDRVEPPKTNCLFWSSKSQDDNDTPIPIVTRASFVYAWYSRWGNYKDGILQPWIVTCQLPQSHANLVPESVSLVQAPPQLPLEAQVDQLDAFTLNRKRRETNLAAAPPEASIAIPAFFSSSSSSSLSVSSEDGSSLSSSLAPNVTKPMQLQYDCSKTAPITNNLPVYNRRPEKKQKFAVCVKGLDFPHEDVSVRLVEWIELLHLLGASKIFLYSLNVHPNISRVLHYYQERGIIELNELTLPGDQPNEPEYQHFYLKSRLTTKRQNELIPYNDCLYRNLHSFEYLALLDIDEIIMPLRHRNWHELMAQVETESLKEQNYSRASYNARNVYFFDDLAGPLGTTSSSAPEVASGSAWSSNSERMRYKNEHQSGELESGIPHYLHMMQHVYRSRNYTKPGQYIKCFHNTERVVSLHNHFPMNCFGQCTTYSIPVELAHLQHYRKDCVGPLRQSCKSDFRVYTQRDTTIWKYKSQMIRRTTRVLNKLGFETSGRPQIQDESARNELESPQAT